MTPYANLRGNSGVASFDIGEESISIAFTDGAEYLYTYRSAGREAVERMKDLAKAGEGLNAFITSQVKKRYARKLDNWKR